MVVGNVVGRICRILVHVLLGRALGPATYGLYTLGRTVAMLAQEVAALGLQTGIVRYGAEQYGKGHFRELKGTLVASFLIGTVSSILIAAALYLGASWVSNTIFSEPTLAPVLRVFSLSVPFYVLNYLASRAARAVQRMHLDVTLRIVAQPLTNLILLSIVFLIGFGLGGALQAFLWSAIISAAISAVVIIRLFPYLGSAVAPVYATKRLLSYSATVVSAGVTVLFLSQTDRLMLGMFGTPTDVGIYSVAALAASQSLFVLDAVNSSFAPMISDLFHRGERKQLEDLFKASTRWTFTLTLPLFLVFLAYPGTILGVFGPSFQSGTTVLIVLACAFFIDAAVGSVGVMLQMTDRHHILTVNNLVMAALNAALNLLLIRRFGATGAAAATGISIGLINLIKLIEVRMFIGIHPYNRAFLRPLAAGLASITIAMLIQYLFDGPWVGFLGILAAALTYVFTLLALGIDSNDQMIARAMFAKISTPGRGAQRIPKPPSHPLGLQANMDTRPLKRPLQ